MITQDKTGGRTVQLFIPFELGGKKIESITLAPLRLGHVLRWNEGAWKTMVALMVELSGVDESVIRELRYPDAERVMEAFMAMLTPEIRNDMQLGRIPLPTETPEATANEPQATNGKMVGPGVPLPDAETGFDMSEEP